MMEFTIREVTENDSPFLWQMLYYAARVSEDGASAPDSAQSVPFLRQYVEEWGKLGDFGLIAIDVESQQALGAAWLRLLIEDKASVTYHDDETPELAIAVDPTWMGQGIGTVLMHELIEKARLLYPAIVLSVRAGNPAIALYQRFGFEIVGEIVNRVGTLSYKMLLEFDT